MITRLRITTFLQAALLLGVMLGNYSAQAQTDTNMDAMDHSKMDMSAEETSGGMNHDMGAMDHGDMKMQGGSAPPNARDPHAYSGGQEKGVGDYALPDIALMHMADEHNMFSLMFDRLERVEHPGDNSTVYDLMIKYGSDYNKLMLKSEGDFLSGKLDESSTNLVWSHAIAAYWDSQLGVRYDSRMEGLNRSWLAAGVQGLAPYWFEIDAMVFVGEDSRTAIGFEAEYELLITQKLILQPRLEAMVYGKEDLENNIGKGLTHMSIGLRLRYEIKREFAPYIGVEYASQYGDTADMTRLAGEGVSDTRLLAGLRFWY